MRSFVIGITAAVWLAPATAGDLPVERLFDAPDLQGPSLRQMRFSPDGKLVSYLRGRDDAPAVFDLWAYDIERRSHRRLVDSRGIRPGGREALAGGRGAPRATADCGAARYRRLPVVARFPGPSRPDRG